MGAPAFKIPDFVVVGGQYELDDGMWVILVASNKLSYAQIKEELRVPDQIFMDRWAREPEWDMFITAKVREYVMVRGRTYPEAWQALFDMWSPENLRHHLNSGKVKVKEIGEFPRGQSESS